MDERKRAEERERLGRVFAGLGVALDERARRLVAAAEARALGHGGVALVAQVTGLARSTIRRGIVDVATTDQPNGGGREAQRVRRPGGGRKRLTARDPTLLRDLEALVEPATRGAPQSPLRWTSKRLSKLAVALQAAPGTADPENGLPFATPTTTFRTGAAAGQ